MRRASSFPIPYVKRMYHRSAAANIAAQHGKWRRRSLIRPSRNRSRYFPISPLTNSTLSPGDPFRRAPRAPRSLSRRSSAPWENIDARFIAGRALSAGNALRGISSRLSRDRPARSSPGRFQFFLGSRDFRRSFAVDCRDCWTHCERGFVFGDPPRKGELCVSLNGREEGCYLLSGEWLLFVCRRSLSKGSFCSLLNI